MSTSLWFDIKTQFLQSSSRLTQLIIANVLVFILLGMVRLIYFFTNDLRTFDGITEYVGLSPHIPTVLNHPWTLVTYAFVHFSFFHLLFNMLILYWVGIILTDFLGDKKLWPLYLMASWCGGVLYIIIYNLFPVFKVSAFSPTMIGASAGVLGIVFAAATLVPDYTIYLLLLGPVRLKWIALTLILIDLIAIPLGNAGGHIAHLGGAVFGYLFIKSLNNGTDLSSWWPLLIGTFQPKKRSRRYLKADQGGATKQNQYNVKSRAEQSAQQRVDIILDKIAQSGYESLTKEEKTFLFNYSNTNKKE